MVLRASLSCSPEQLVHVSQAVWQCSQSQAAGEVQLVHVRQAAQIGGQVGESLAVIDVQPLQRVPQQLEARQAW